MNGLILNALAGLILAVNGQHYDGEGQTVSFINVTGSDITVENYRVSDSGPGTNAVSVWGDRNTLRNLQIEKSGAAGVYFVRGDGHVLEDSVIRDPVTRPGQDSWGIYSDAATNLTVRNNTVHGSGYTQWNPVSVGTRILNNTFVIPDDYRTDCKGNRQADGPCQCGEFGIAIKGGDGGQIIDNVISGYRKSDPVCGGSGSPGTGIATSACAPSQTCDTKHWLIQGNLITDSHFGIYHGLHVDDVRIIGNRFCRNDSAISDGFSVNSAIKDNIFAANGRNVHIYGFHRVEVSGGRKVWKRDMAEVCARAD